MEEAIDYRNVLHPTLVRDLVQSWIREDTSDFDYAGAVVGNEMATATILCKSRCVLAGIPFADAIFQEFSCNVQWLVSEGTFLAADGQRQKVATVEGPSRNILLAERLVLNCLCRSSGVATVTRNMKVKLKVWKGQLAATRKTTPGFRMVEKYAVMVGGASTHRNGLSEMVMLKDNHLALFKDHAIRNRLTNSSLKEPKDNNTTLMVSNADSSTLTGPNDENSNLNGPKDAFSTLSSPKGVYSTLITTKDDNSTLNDPKDDNSTLISIKDDNSTMIGPKDSTLTDPKDDISTLTHSKDSSPTDLKVIQSSGVGHVAEAVLMARTISGFARKIEIECSDVHRALEAAEAGCDVIMLDNLTGPELHAAAAVVKKLFPRVLIEASGGIDENNVIEFAGPHIDVISSSALVQGYPAVDFSMKVVPGYIRIEQ